MATGKFIAYYRVSTKRQGRSGLGLEAQKNAVADYLNGGRWTLVDEVTEVESGRRNDRPELKRALALCRVYGARLVVAKMDRLSRNVHFLSGLMESKVPFVAADMPDANELTIHILAAVAQAEANAISARTKAALATSKKKLGGRKSNSASIHRVGVPASAVARAENARKRAADVMPVIEAVRATGAQSLRQIADGLNERSVPAPRGGHWTATQVMRVMKHASVSA